LKRGNNPQLLIEQVLSQPIRNGIPLAAKGTRRPRPPHDGFRGNSVRVPLALKPLADMQVAYLHDVQGETSREIAPQWGFVDLDDISSASKSAQRTWKSGRNLLRDLGAWPWACHAGSFPHLWQWSGKPTFLVPLERWRHRADEEARRDLDWKAARARGEAGLWG
jgi:hypothetical protein